MTKDISSRFNPSDYDSWYNDSTHMILREMQERKPTELCDQSNGDVIAFIDGDNLVTLSPSCALAKAILCDAMYPGETQEMFAERCGIHAVSSLSNVLTPNSDRSPSQELALRVILMLNPLPGVVRFNHLLMELQRPGLFTNTMFVHTNRVNFILQQVCKYANSSQAQCNPDCNAPDFSWLAFVQHIFQYFSIDYLGSSSAPRRTGSPQTNAFLEQLETAVNETTFQFQSTGHRAFLLERYMKQNGYQTKNAAYAALSRAAGFSDSMIKGLLAARTTLKNKGSRDALIRIGIAMGLSLQEVNTLLMQANFSVLYPRCYNSVTGLESDSDFCFCKSLVIGK